MTRDEALQNATRIVKALPGTGWQTHVGQAACIDYTEEPSYYGCALRAVEGRRFSCNQHNPNAEAVIYMDGKYLANGADPTDAFRRAMNAIQAEAASARKLYDAFAG